MTSSKKFLAIPAAAVALSMGAGAVARAAEPTTEELLQKINALQSQVEQLKATQETQSALSAKQVDATVERVLTDADKRSQLLQIQGFTAGYTNGRFTLQDAAGDFVLRPSLEFQFLSVNSMIDGGENGDDEKQKGFEVSRMAFGFDGNVCSPDLTYAFMWNTSTDGNVYLETAMVRYRINDLIQTRTGQFVNPVFHEQVVGGPYQLAAARSLANALITGTDRAFTQGSAWTFTPSEQLSFEIGLTDGFDTGNTDWLDPSFGGSTDWGAIARLNYFVNGTPLQAADFTARGNKDNLLAIGGGLDATQTGDTTQLLHTVDVQWENAGGLAIYAAYLGNYYMSGEDAIDGIFNYGAVVQAGYMLNDRWELFGRYSYTHFDSELAALGGAEEFCDMTLGVNWYMCEGNNAKVTVDLTYLPNGSPRNLTDIGILASEDEQLILRGQFTLVL